MTNTVVFIDTNTLLHYKFVDQIDWLTLFGASKLSIAIAPIVLHELNSIKDNSLKPKKIRKRAASITNRLSGFIDKADQIDDGLWLTVRSNIYLLLIGNSPTIDFAAHQLSKDINDDWLIASMISFQEHHSEANLSLVSNDTELILKSKIRRIPSFRLPENLKLPEQPDEEEKHVKQLEEEILKLKQRAPILSAKFHDDSDHQIITIRCPKQFDVKAFIISIAEKHPKISRDPFALIDYLDLDEDERKKQLSEAIFGSSWQGIASDDIVEYNKKLDLFYDECLRIQRAFAERISIRIFLKISNSGSSPANNVRIVINCPNEAKIYQEDTLPQSPVEPKPPAKPLTIFEKANYEVSPTNRGDSKAKGSVDFLDLLHHSTLPLSPRVLNTHVVQYVIPALQHHDEAFLTPFYVVYNSFDLAQSLRLQYAVVADDLPNMITGHLDLIIEKEGL